jgi:phosphoglycerate dehydrogenase-like enzyme
MAERTTVEILSTIAFPEPLLEQLREISPRVRVKMQPVQQATEIADEVWGKIEVLYTATVLPEPAKVPNLRWVQFHLAGVEYALDANLLRQPQIRFTTLSGAAAPQVAEYVVSMFLALGHHLPEMMALKSRAEWPHRRGELFNPHELHGSTVGIVGYGSIGREVARLLQPFHPTILAAKSDVMHPEDDGYMPEGLGDPQGDLFDRLYPVQALRSMLKECDFVMVAVPLTPATRDLLGEEELKALKPTAFLVDVSRGGIVNPEALLAVLQEKRIQGAALDVFPQEPLPADSPFWQLPNVIISPHISGFSAKYMERAMALFAKNLELYLNGVALLNQLDTDKKY